MEAVLRNKFCGAHVLQDIILKHIVWYIGADVDLAWNGIS